MFVNFHFLSTNLGFVDVSCMASGDIQGQSITHKSRLAGIESQTSDKTSDFPNEIVGFVAICVSDLKRYWFEIVVICETSVFRTLGLLGFISSRKERRIRYQ